MILFLTILVVSLIVVMAGWFERKWSGDGSTGAASIAANIVALLAIIASVVCIVL